MKTVAPTATQIQAFAAQADDNGPVIMLNLLRYRAQADYTNHPDESTCSGREAYRRYAAKAIACIESVGGKVCFAGAAQTVVIGPEDERWDDVLLVHYPSRQAFFAMLSSEQYRSIGFHRTAALDDSRLVAITPGATGFQV